MEKDLKIVVSDRKDGLGLLDTVLDVSGIVLGDGNASKVNDHIILYKDTKTNIDYFIGYDFSNDRFIDITLADTKYIKSLN